MSAFKELDATVKIALLPAELGDINNAIHKKLQAMLFVWSFELQAVPLFFSDTKFNYDKKVGRVIGEMPWIHIDAAVKILVF